MNPSQFPQIQAYPHVRAQCARTLDLYIGDLRSILQLPLIIKREMQPQPNVTLVEMPGGGNFVLCSIILDIMAGLSVCLHIRKGRIGFDTEGTHDRGDRFRGLLEDYYPWNYESLQKTEVSKVLWAYLRNPLVHNLGILPFRGTTVAGVNIDRFSINKSPMDLQEVLGLEDTVRPLKLSPTFDLNHTTFNVNAPCLYWGLHQLLRNLFSDAGQMAQVEAWYTGQAATGGKK